MDSVELSIAYVIAVPLQRFSVVFVVDPSPIYRVTDQEVCAGIETPHHRLIVEYRGECDVWDELVRLGFVSPLYNICNYLEHGSARLQLPTLANVAKGWTPRPHINAQILQLMEGK